MIKELNDGSYIVMWILIVIITVGLVIMMNNNNKDGDGF